MTEETARYDTGNAASIKPSDDQGFELRLHNWADWCRSGGIGQGRCGSAERYYRSGFRESDGATLIDYEDAKRIEAGICRLSIEHRELLKGIYLYRERWEVISRRAGIRYPNEEGKRAAWLRGAKVALIMSLSYPGYP